MKKISSLILVLLLHACNLEVQKNETLEEKANELQYSNIKFDKVVQLATGFKFTEGPAADKNGNIFFTDIPESKIYIWKTNDELEVFSEASNGANGLFFDRNEVLYICEGYSGRISAIKNKSEYSIIAEKFNNKQFNQPNDIWVHPNGSSYFTDPFYGDSENTLPQEGMHVYRIAPNQEQKIMRVTNDLIKPNGIIGTPDGKKLYITDQKDNKTFEYTIQEDGSLVDKKMILAVGGDGMTLDILGNIYLTTNGKMAVEVYSPDGKLLASIDLPEQPSNVTFGGKHKNELYITARKSLYKVNTNTEGVY